ncbi:hypothetical protein [Paenibacillus sp. J2TS4]|uniref:hypothetical protein n=1 Tax=Paenibacillus sp. J2TS4 TaxID=2807194 RepID=UPI001B10DB17|nr:hypothetical protein [Paenibacillus sp. J2TS4]GIP32059.1 hypothetical protein J2TS4_12690 [Paenibacillus sp. J2TS4]
MEIYNKLIQIRMANKSTTNQKVFSIVIAMITGVIMGLTAKLVDNSNINPIFDDIGGRLGIWVFVATILSVFSYSPKMAAVKVFAFFGSMLTVYYVYTTSVLHFFPERAIVFWGICAAVSPICAYVMWYARGSGLFSNMISALPITVLLSEGFKLRDAYLPIHHHYYLVPWLMGVYLIMIVALLLIIPKNKREFWVILPTAIILSLIMLNFNILGRIFGGMNGVL